MKVYTAEEKIEEMNLGIRIEKLTINKLEKEKETAELCRQVEINKQIKLSKLVIKNCEEKIGHLEESWL